MSENLIIRISNGLGNQLFMYASAYGMSKKLNRKLLIDNESSFKSTKNISDYLLNNFNITSEIASDRYKFKSLYGYLKRKFLLKTDLFRKKKFFYIEKKNLKKITNYNDDFLNKFFNNNMYVEGYFESEKYFFKTKFPASTLSLILKKLTADSLKPSRIVQTIGALPAPNGKSEG